MYYIIGDIHGYFTKLSSLVKILLNDFNNDEDSFVFLGDYIDRGHHSFEVIEFLIQLSDNYNTVFLKGNHEDMMLKFLSGESGGDAYLYNGGDATIKSYEKNVGTFKLPDSHDRFFKGLQMYFEAEDFIAVHAGLNPAREIIDQEERDMIWIRDGFFRADKKWEKTIIFGHTPTTLFTRKNGVVIDAERNIVALDNGVIFGNPLACIRMPDKKLYYSR